MIMNNIEFTNKAKELASLRTVYALGTYCNNWTSKLLDRKSKQYKDWYTPARKTALNTMVDSNCIAADCVGVIKGILWGYSMTTVPKYVSNSVPDTNANGLAYKLINVSTNMNSIEIGEVLWMPGHVGIYIGNGKVVESAPSIGKIGITSINYQKWEKHGKLPWVDYTYTNIEVTKYESEKIKALQIAVKDLGYKGKDGKELTIDGKAGTNTLFAVSMLLKDIEAKKYI